MDERPICRAEGFVGCGKMKKRRNEAAKSGEKMEIHAGTYKRGRKMKRKLLGTGALLLALPVYSVSNGLFQLAVCRDNSHSLLRREGLKKIWNDINGRVAERKRRREERRGKSGNGQPERGLAFADFTQELEAGKAWFEEQEKERITMTSHDGLKLVAYFLPAEVESNKILILMHGYRNKGMVWDFANLVKFYHEMGYHLLVPYQRAHGESEGKYICFGVKERYDLVQWTEYIAGRFGEKCHIFLSGISMGCTTVLMAAGLKLPEQVKGLIADCGFTSPWDIFAHVLVKDCHLPKFPFLYVADYICRAKAGFHFQECSAVDSMKWNRIPVLFIHGGKDDFVPAKMSRINYDACGAEKEIFIVDRAAHGTCNLVEPEAYRQKVTSFMERCLDKT